MVRRARKLPHFVWARSLRRLNNGLARLETRRESGGETPLPQKPIFVVGAPRSGSTLLYQLLVVRFDVAYLSNLHCRFFGAPAFVERAVGKRLRPPGDFSSRFGSTRGLAAPSECGPYWYRFFRKSPQHVSLAEADPNRLGQLRESVRAFARAAGRPLVFKNLVNSVRLVPLGAALPEALFVFVRRDEADTAASILAGRRAVNADESKWWSVEPPEIERLRTLPPQEQVLEQVRAVESLVDEAREEIGRDRFLDVRYEDVCADTHRALESVMDFVERHGVALRVRRDVPARFEPGAHSSLQSA
ncbi:MAG: sulfotransferase family protein [Gaiellaceae bacterium]